MKMSILNNKLYVCVLFLLLNCFLCSTSYSTYYFDDSQSFEGLMQLTEEESYQKALAKLIKPNDVEVQQAINMKQAIRYLEFHVSYFMPGQILSVDENITDFGLARSSLKRVIQKFSALEKNSLLFLSARETHNINWFGQLAPYTLSDVIVEVLAEIEQSKNIRCSKLL